MLTIIVPSEEYYDEINEVFITSGEVKLDLEHSLASLSKWESIYEKPFLGKDEKTNAEVMGYIKTMILTPDFPPEVLDRLTEVHLNQINNYINSKQSATWFGEDKTTRPSREIITSELIYYWMVSMDIPFECQYWHLNRLFTLIRVINVKNAKPKKMSRSEIAERNRALNQQRRAQLGTRG